MTYRDESWGDISTPRITLRGEKGVREDGTGRLGRGGGMGSKARKIPPSAFSEGENCTLTPTTLRELA